MNEIEKLVVEQDRELERLKSVIKLLREQLRVRDRILTAIRELAR